MNGMEIIEHQIYELTINWHRLFVGQREVLAVIETKYIWEEKILFQLPLNYKLELVSQPRIHKLLEI
jgi:hypothetical protein